MCNEGQAVIGITQVNKQQVKADLSNHRRERKTIIYL